MHCYNLAARVLPAQIYLILQGVRRPTCPIHHRRDRRARTAEQPCFSGCSESSISRVFADLPPFSAVCTVSAARCSSKTAGRMTVPALTLNRAPCRGERLTRPGKSPARSARRRRTGRDSRGSPGGSPRSPYNPQGRRAGRAGRDAGDGPISAPSPDPRA